MDIGIVSMRYAKALIDYAYNSGKEDVLYREFSTLAHSFEKHPELREALLNPILSAKDKFALICTAAAGEQPTSEEFNRCFALIQKTDAKVCFNTSVCLSRHYTAGRSISEPPN